MSDSFGTESSSKSESALDRRCDGDTDLKNSVQSLLDADSRAGAFLEPLHQAHAIHPLLASHSLIGERFGAFTIRGVLGRGGMSTVCDAEQDHPRRRVALKVLRFTLLAGKTAVSFFGREAAALARLQHPGIAAIFGAGSEDGYHFFAMELVEGTPITQHARDRGLSLSARLDLLRKLCEAVHYAHQRGVIHRDLKPSNILVTKDGRPKVLDFGIARVTESDLETATCQTNIGELFGTIPYMSPEQSSGDPAELDTRTDVYSLGVIGYELLVGSLPYEVSPANIPVALDVIQNVAPMPPRRLQRDIPADLSVILLKALQKDKEQRYPTASALADDLTRLLRHEPIVARAPSLPYQLRKFVLRHKAFSGVLAGSILAILVAMALAVYQWRDAAYQAAIVEDTSHVMKSLLTSAYPSPEEGSTYTVRQLLDDFTLRMDQDDSLAVEVEASVRRTIAEGYKAFSAFVPAITQCDRASELFRQAYGEGDLRSGENTVFCAWIAHDVQDHASMEERFEACLPEFEEHFGVDHWLVGAALLGLADARTHLGQLESAEALGREGIEILSHDEDTPPGILADGLTVMGFVFESKGRPGDAVPFLRQALHLTPRTRKDRIAIANAAKRLGPILLELGDLAQAEVALRKAVEWADPSVPIYTHAAIRSRIWLARALKGQGKRGEAEAMLVDADQILSRMDGHDSYKQQVAEMLADLQEHGK